MELKYCDNLLHRSRIHTKIIFNSSKLIFRYSFHFTHGIIIYHIGFSAFYRGYCKLKSDEKGPIQDKTPLDLSLPQSTRNYLYLNYFLHTVIFEGKPNLWLINLGTIVFTQCLFI